MDRRLEVEQVAGTFLEAMRLSLSAQVTEAEDHIQVDLSGSDSFLLLEKKGACLEALQLLMGKVAESRGVEKRLVVDCDGYRSGRDDKLAQSALKAAEQVRKTRRPVELEPMNSYERRIVHLALAEAQGVSTQSHGEGPLKRIVISPA